MKYAIVSATFIGIPCWAFFGFVGYQWYRSQLPPVPPLIPGATAAEQDGPIVANGYRLGRQYRSSLLTGHSDSWAGAASQFETGKDWSDVRDQWTIDLQSTRDAAFDVVIQPSIDTLIPPGREPSPSQRHNVVLFVRSFAAGLRDRVR